MAYIGHGGKEIVERVMSPSEAKEKIKGLTSVEISNRAAYECIDLAYGFFTPLEGFMCKADVDAVCEKMTLADGTVWSIPIVFDIDSKEIEEKGIKVGDTILLTYTGNPLAILDVEEIYEYDKDKISQAVLGTTDEKHPGVRMVNRMKDRFIGGKITLVNQIKLNSPFDQFFYTPKQLRDKFAQLGWERIVAHQTRNVPHTGHEWLMKGAWFCAHGDAPVVDKDDNVRLGTAVLVSCIIGPKRTGDYIDEAILLAHQALHDGRYFREDVHMVSIALWHMRYAGPKEAIFHAILRANLGCTHHMFGRDHAGVGDYYETYGAHRIFDDLPEGALKLKPVRVLEWWYCPLCAEVTYSGLCGHSKERQKFSGTLIRSIIKDGVKPTRLIMRPEVFDAVMESADKYGFGTPFCTEEYLEKRQPVFEVPPLD